MCVWGNQSIFLQSGIPVDLYGMISYDNETGIYCLNTNRLGMIGNVVQMLLALVATGVTVWALFRVYKFGIVFHKR